jgi:uncharacterized protein
MSQQLKLKKKGSKSLTKEIILKKIKENKEKIKEFGVEELFLFGSYLEGRQKKSSDIDFLVKFETGRGNNMKDFFGLYHFLEDLFEKKIDLGDKHLIREELKPYINENNALRCEI